MNNEPMILSLAPMAGITDYPMRKLCLEYGCNRTTTEMISAMGFVTAPKGSRVYRDLLYVGPDEQPPVAQIFGHDPQIMARAAAALQDMGCFSGVEINMGCPAHKVVSSGSGSALMKDLPLCADILSAVRKSITLPLSVKMRLGWDEEHPTAASLARLCAQEGVDHITVHARTARQQYAGQAAWSQVQPVVQSVSLPVWINGDITDVFSARVALSESDGAGVAIGRGALGNPFIFQSLAAWFKGETFSQPVTDLIILSTALRHIDWMTAWKGEKRAAIEMRKHVCWYIKGKKGAAKARPLLMNAPTTAMMKQLLCHFFEQCEDEP